MGGLATMEEVSRAGGTDLRNAFDAGIGSSAGLMNMVHWVAGHAGEGIGVYADDLTTGRFMPRLQPFDFQTARHDVGHVLRNGLKLADLDYLADYALQKQGRITEFGGRISKNVYAVVTDAETGLPIALRMSPDDPELYEIFKATGALPVIYNEVIEVAGGRYVDGGATSSVPLTSAAALDPKPKHIIAILTREYGYRNQPHNLLRNFLYKTGVVALARGKQSDAILQLIGSRQNEINFNYDMERMESPDGIDPVTGIRFTLIQPSDPGRMTSRLTVDRDRIIDAAEMGKEDMKRALEEVQIPV
jgi:predicted acylesterase/phospholipase RssA